MLMYAKLLINVNSNAYTITERAYLQRRASVNRIESIGHMYVCVQCTSIIVFVTAGAAVAIFVWIIFPFLYFFSLAAFCSQNRQLAMSNVSIIMCLSYRSFNFRTVSAAWCLHIAPMSTTYVSLTSKAVFCFCAGAFRPAADANHRHSKIAIAYSQNMQMLCISLIHSHMQKVGRQQQNGTERNKTNNDENIKFLNEFISKVPPSCVAHFTCSNPLHWYFLCMLSIKFLVE